MSRLTMTSYLLFAALALGAKPTLADDALAKFQDDSRGIVGELSARLGAAMQKAMAASGPAGAIKVCKEVAPAAAAELSRKHGQRVARVSLKLRNPSIGAPDAWEQKVLLDFEKRSEKEGAANLELAELVSEPQGKYLRYMKAVPVLPLCLNCHGKPEAMTPEVREQLATDYPHDKATGYTAGQIRGAITIKKPL